MTLKITLVLLILTIICMVLYVGYQRLYKKQDIQAALYVLFQHNALLLLSAELLSLFLAFLSSRAAELKSFIDTGLLTTAVLTVFVGIASQTVKKLIMNHLEDNAKLTKDYSALIRKYRKENTWISVDNKNASPDNLKKLKKQDKTEAKFPVIIDAELYQKEIRIEDDKTKAYMVPEVLLPYEKELMAAHDTSNVYNQLNIRVDDWNMNGEVFSIKTSRTTYFSSLVTNRAMDYKLSNYMSVREMTQYGPYLPNIGESVLSNHLGVNGLVISSDRKFPLVKRSKEMSIGKRTYGTSVAASLKTMYALDEQKVFTADGIRNAIIKEIEDELKITPDGLILPEKLTDWVVYAYRDIVEGNKPQLLFFTKSKWDSQRIQETFLTEMAQKAKVKVPMSAERRDLEDGNKLEWISLDELNDIVFLPDKIIAHGKVFPTGPSSAATVFLFKEFYNAHLG